MDDKQSKKFHLCKSKRTLLACKMGANCEDGSTCLLLPKLSQCTMDYLDDMQVEQKIVEELQSLGLVATAAQAEPRVPDHADLAKLTYLSCVIKEAMRVHTVSSSLYQATSMQPAICAIRATAAALQAVQRPDTTAQGFRKNLAPTRHKCF